MGAGLSPWFLFDRIHRALDQYLFTLLSTRRHKMRAAHSIAVLASAATVVLAEPRFVTYFDQYVLFIDHGVY